MANIENMISSKSVKYPNFFKLCPNWTSFFYTEEMESILYPILLHIKDQVFYPPPEHIFRCFYETPLEKVNVVLIGQDPYHNGSATGLCFDVKLGNTINPSLLNIYKELENEGFYPTKDGILSSWATQGILLINTALTVKPGLPESHLDLWSPFFQKVMEHLATKDQIIWILLGKKAIDYRDKITNDTHIIIESTHPSPLSAHKNAGNIPGFLGSGVFKKVNETLKKMGKKEISW
jgi:uracil-DNA glycosylase